MTGEAHPLADPKVYIEVRGGVVQYLASVGSVQVFLRDYDDLADHPAGLPPAVEHTMETDAVDESDFNSLVETGEKD